MNVLNFRYVDLTLNHGDKEVICPRRQSSTASGLDLVCASKSAITIAPGAWALVPTGIAIELEPGFEAQVRSRSGLAAKQGIMVLNSPGTIDADYRGEIKVILMNLSTVPVDIEFGDRIAQLVVCPVMLPILREVVDLSSTERGTDGFGSTGTRVCC